MISCQQLIDFCLGYLEGELPASEREQFQRHLSRCPDCECFFETYRRTPDVSREALAMAIPNEVKESVRAYLRAHRDR